MDFRGKAAPCTGEGLSRAVEMIGCAEAALRAVIDVETGGSGFDHAGRPKALFEPHIFHRLLSQLADRAVLARAVAAGVAYANWGTRPYPVDSYANIATACEIDEDLGLKATSWGLPQILGSNHSAAGWSSAKEMVVAFGDSEDAQLEAMARFIVANKLDGALRGKDWATFAKGYNGPGYVTHGYQTKLANAYKRFCGAQPGPTD